MTPLHTSRLVAAIAITAALLACKKHKSSSESSPAAAETTNVAPAAGTYAVGQNVEVLWKGKWYPATILAQQGTSYRVHYTGYSSSWDEAVTPERVRQAAVTAPAAAAPAATAQPRGVPTDTTSPPPTTAEWNGVGEITVRHSTPLGCETKMVREWLRVSCRTPASQHTQIQGARLVSGSDSHIPPFAKKGVASIVTQVRHGANIVYEFSWNDWGTRRLTVSWPNGAPAPTIAFDAPPPND